MVMSVACELHASIKHRSLPSKRTLLQYKVVSDVPKKKGPATRQPFLGILVRQKNQAVLASAG
jgi:hypothetical protein